MAMAKTRTPLITCAIVSILLLGLQSLLINPKQEAWALDFKSYTVTGNLASIKYMSVGGKDYYVTLSGSPATQVQVETALNRTITKSFNMTNALVKGINVPMALDNMDCNSALAICVASYTCQCTTNGARERVVLIDPLNGLYSSLKNGANYTSASWALENTVISYGGGQYNVFATYADQAGFVHTKIDTWVYNTTSSVDAQPLILGNVFDTGSVTIYKPLASLATMSISGVNHNIEGIVDGGTTLHLFDRGYNTPLCTAGLVGGFSGNDITFVSDTIGQFFYVSDGHVINRINSACAVTTADIGPSDGNNNVASINVDMLKHYIFTTAQTKLFVLNETSFSTTPITSYALPTANAISYNGIANVAQAGSTQGNVAIAQTGTNTVYIIYWGVAGTSGGGNPSSPNNTCGAQNSANCEGQVNCELPANINLVMCQGKPINGNNGNAFNNGVSLLNNTNAVVAQGIGLSNQNIKTNGVGYIFLFITLLLGNILWLLAVHSFGNKGVVVPQPIFVSIILSFCIIMGFVLMGITDPLILILSVVVAIAFTAPKAVSMIRGSEPIST